MRKRKILYLITSLNTLGPAKALVNIGINIDTKNFDVVFCHCDGDSDGVFHRILRSRNIPIYGLNTRGALDIRAVYRLIQVLRREKVDILHSRMARADFLGRVAGYFYPDMIIVTNISYIYTDHFKTWHKPLVGSLLSRLDGLTLKRADWFVPNSEACEVDIIKNVGVPDRKVRRIFNGIDLSLYGPSSKVREQMRLSLGLKSTDLVVGTVANLSKVKGLDVLVEAAAHVVEEAANFVFVIIGEGPERSSIESQISFLGLDTCVRLLGQRDDVTELLQMLDLFAFPSRSEGNPNALLEAMAVGVPVVASDIPGNNLLVEHSVTGYRVAVDSAKELARGILTLAFDKEAQCRQVTAAKSLIADYYSLDKIVMQYEAFYCNLRRD